jgi:hypothetical protein
MTGDELERIGEKQSLRGRTFSPVSSFSSPLRDGELEWRNPTSPANTARGRTFPATFTASQGAMFRRVTVTRCHSPKRFPFLGTIALKSYCQVRVSQYL